MDARTACIGESTVPFGYEQWRNFEEAISRAKQSCASVGVDPANQFAATSKMVEIGSQSKRSIPDYFLARFACYLIAMNGDPSKPEIAAAQAYFAVQTRRMELIDQLPAEERRMFLRERVTQANRHLSGAAKRAGVRTNMEFAIFQDAGYRGLYGGFSLKDIKRMKGLPGAADLLDRAGHAELAANEFRITQTEQKLSREPISGAKAVTDTHHGVGREVRASIARIGGTMPEHLPAEPSIKKIAAKRRKAVAKPPAKSILPSAK